MFFRVDNSRDTATGGVGLGLAIAQRAILVHHGQIWAENAEPGLRVSVDLPVACYFANSKASAEGVDTMTPVPEDCTSPLMA